MKAALIVDVQNDFMKADGALYVPGAEEIIPTIKYLAEKLKKDGTPTFFTFDRHFGDEVYEAVETELQRNSGPFPDHCMVGTKGAEPITEVDLWERLHLLPNSTLGTTIVLGFILRSNGAVAFEKQTYDVFTNTSAEQILTLFEEVIVFGVATDYCVKAAVDGLVERGVKVTVVQNAIKGIDDRTVEKLLKEWENNPLVRLTFSNYI